MSVSSQSDSNLDEHLVSTIIYTEVQSTLSIYIGKCPNVPELWLRNTTLHYACSVISLSYYIWDWDGEVMWKVLDWDGGGHLCMSWIVGVR